MEWSTSNTLRDLETMADDTTSFRPKRLKLFSLLGLCMVLSIAFLTHEPRLADASSDKEEDRIVTLPPLSSTSKSFEAFSPFTPIETNIQQTSWFLFNEEEVKDAHPQKTPPF